MTREHREQHASTVAAFAAALVSPTTCKSNSTCKGGLHEERLSEDVNSSEDTNLLDEGQCSILLLCKCA